MGELAAVTYPESHVGADRGLAYESLLLAFVATALGIGLRLVAE